MEIKFLDETTKNVFDEDILSMLYEADEDFVPPLSARNSTTQKNLSAVSDTENGVKSYFDELKKQKFMVCTEDNTLLAFVSYKEDYINDEISEDFLPNIYISTLIVKKEGRGKGITTSMYGVLFEKYKDRNIFTRTWSTNAAHIKVLSKYGFNILTVLKNHRGNGIDTIYFKKDKEI